MTKKGEFVKYIKDIQRKKRRSISSNKKGELNA